MCVQSRGFTGASGLHMHYWWSIQLTNTYVILEAHSKTRGRNLNKKNKTKISLLKIDWCCICNISAPLAETLGTQKLSRSCASYARL